MLEFPKSEIYTSVRGKLFWKFTSAQDRVFRKKLQVLGNLTFQIKSQVLEFPKSEIYTSARENLFWNFTSAQDRVFRKVQVSRNSISTKKLQVSELI